MKTLCLGGSFNPIHHGHLVCARAVAESAGYERILLIPSAQPPHKPGQPDLADPSDRLNMCRLAVQAPGAGSAPRGQLSFDVSEIELTRTGPSYTIETVRELRRRGWTDVDWLIGADMLNYLPMWHEAAALVREARLVIMARAGVPLAWDTLPREFHFLRSNVIEAPLIEISSTQIRRRLRLGQSIDYLTPPAVIDYIRSKCLYRDESSIAGTTADNSPEAS